METAITIIKADSQCWGMPRTMTMEQLAEDVRSTRYEERVEKVMRQCTEERLGKNTGDRRLSKRVGRLPCLIFSSLFSAAVLTGSELQSGRDGHAAANKRRVL